MPSSIAFTPTQQTPFASETLRSKIYRRARTSTSSSSNQYRSIEYNTSHKHTRTIHHMSISFIVIVYMSHVWVVSMFISPYWSLLSRFNCCLCAFRMGWQKHTRVTHKYAHFFTAVRTLLHTITTALVVSRIHTVSIPNNFELRSEATSAVGKKETEQTRHRVKSALREIKRKRASCLFARQQILHSITTANLSKPN